VGKFKVGDRVIVIDDQLRPHQRHFLGKRGIIKEIDETCSGNFDCGQYFSLFSFKLELEAVYESPLYQALL